MGLIALIGCTQSAAPTAQQGSFRARKPMYSTADLPIARMLGTWRQVAGFGAAQPCTKTPALDIAAKAGGAVARYDLCLGTKRYSGEGPIASAGAQGRYRLPNLPAPIWVLWIDEGNRSLAIGTPDGGFGAILSKDPIPADRLRAAREVLAWNGYDLTQFYQY